MAYKMKCFHTHTPRGARSGALHAGPPGGWRAGSLSPQPPHPTSRHQCLQSPPSREAAFRSQSWVWSSVDTTGRENLSQHFNPELKSSFQVKLLKTTKLGMVGNELANS